MTINATYTCVNYIGVVISTGDNYVVKRVMSIVTMMADFIFLIISLYFLHLLLSGDVELNPGPTFDDRPTLPLLPGMASTPC